MSGVLLLLFAGCELDLQPPADTIDCSEILPNSVQVTITGGPTSEEVDEDLVVTGTASHDAGLTVRSLSVAGVAATNDSFNFQTWTATVPYATLLSLSEDSEDGSATLWTEATDACLLSYEREAFTVLVDQDPGIEVGELALTLELPGEASFLPIDGTTAAVVTLTANPEAAGAVATLGASLGSFSGSDTLSLTLAGDGLNAASAQAVFSATAEGSALLTAAAGGLVASQAVQIAGPPTLIPSEVTLDPGEQFALTVFTDGDVATCSAGYAQGVTVTSGGDDLTESDTAEDSDGDGHVDLLISVSEDLEEEATVSVSCADSYGQRGYARATAVPDGSNSTRSGDHGGGDTGGSGGDTGSSGGDTGGSTDDTGGSASDSADDGAADTAADTGTP